MEVLAYGGCSSVSPEGAPGRDERSQSGQIEGTLTSDGPGTPVPVSTYSLSPRTFGLQLPPGIVCGRGEQCCRLCH